MFKCFYDENEAMDYRRVHGGFVMDREEAYGDWVWFEHPMDWKEMKEWVSNELEDYLLRHYWVSFTQSDFYEALVHIEEVYMVMQDCRKALEDFGCYVSQKDDERFTYHTRENIEDEERKELEQFEEENDGESYELPDFSTHPYWRKDWDDHEGARYEGLDSLWETVDDLAYKTFGYWR